MLFFSKKVEWRVIAIIFILFTLIVGLATVLAWRGIMSGETVAVVYGTIIGYLLSVITLPRMIR